MAQIAATNSGFHPSVTNHNFNMQFNNSTIITTSRRSNHSGHSQQDTLSPRQAIFAFIVTVLLTFIQFKYQTKSESPFETHPMTTLLAIASLVIYCVSYDAKLRISKNHQPPRSSSNLSTARSRFVCINLALFGPLSLASILSILAPQPFCSVLFSLAIFIALCQLPPDLVKTKWDWLKELIGNKFCAQPERTRATTPSTGAVRLVSARLPRIAERPTIDQIDLLPV